jgi:hypothetical protein
LLFFQKLILEKILAMFLYCLSDFTNCTCCSRGGG